MRLELLGPLRVLSDDGTPVPLPTARRERAVLSILALRAPSNVHVGELISGIWGDEPPRSAAKNVQTYISTLRRTLPAGTIDTTSSGYRLNLSRQSIDIGCFEDGVLDGMKAVQAGESTAAIGLLSEALGTWRGEPLLELNDQSVGMAESARLAELRRAAEESLVDARLDAGEHAEIIGDLEAAIGAEPLREKRWAQLMVALYRCGRQADALRAFQRLTTTLAEELGIAPSRELRELEEAILLQDQRLSQRPSLDPSLRTNKELPSGEVTFCFTDIEASTPLLAQLGNDAYQEVLEIHRGLIRHAALPLGAEEVRTEGDGMFFVFRSADEAVVACCEAQRALLGHVWPPGASIRVRMGLHTGQGTVTPDRDYLGLDVHQAARVMTAAHGGQVLASGDVVARVADVDPVHFQDLGDFALRGLDRATRLHQLCHPELHSEFPPPRVPSAGVHNLGAQRTSFVGRDNELASLAKLLETPALVTIVGPGGMGKTRLAAEVGLRMVRHYPAGVWLVSLADLGDEHLLASSVASALGVLDRSPRGIEEAVIDRLSGAATLLIVDNCEHLIKGCAELLARWLKVCPELTILATSREHLGLAEEHVFRLSSLSETAAITLIAQRAAQARSGFAVTAANSAAISEICRRLDGMPLALELAAARLAAFSPAQVADRLAETLDVLDAGRRGGDTRHWTLRAALDWSYELLDVKERDAIRRLAVFRGGFDAAAAEAVANASWDVLGNLVNQSLVEVDHDIDDPRFRLLEPVRQYAWSLANAPEQETTQLRHASWVVELAKQAGREVMLHPARWLERLEGEHPNIEAAVEWSLGRSDDQSALRIVGYLGYYWVMSGHGEAFGWIERALDRTNQASTRLRARGLLVGAMLLHRPQEARSIRTVEQDSHLLLRSAAWAREAAEVFQETGPRGSVAWALFWEARALAQFDEASARTQIAEALQIFRDVNDPLGVCWCLARAAAFAKRDQRWADAEALYSESLELGRGTGVDHAVGDALSQLGKLAGRAGDHQRAVELTGEAVVHGHAHDPWQLCISLSTFGLALYSAGDHGARRRQ